uniref:Uncharacterized protein n=1 Tax=Arundo donax TaxID=35708 RepID=A0A0A9F9E6_ARUDO
MPSRVEKAIWGKARRGKPSFLHRRRRRRRRQGAAMRVVS